MRNWPSFIAVTALSVCAGSAQQPSPNYLVAWLEATPGSSLVERLRSKLAMLSDFFERVTSPDIRRAEKHLWVISVDGKRRCLLSPENGVREPRWGSSGYILYLVETDTNGDGRIDYRDEFLVRVIPASGGRGMTIGQGQSALWSPDGRYVAVLRGGQIELMSRDGSRIQSGSSGPTGRLIVTDSRALESTRRFWALDARTLATEELPETLRRKFLWLERLSPSGRQIVFMDAVKSDLWIRAIEEHSVALNLTNDEPLDLDPAWSPDETQIVYVSTNPRNGPLCAPPKR